MSTPVRSADRRPAIARAAVRWLVRSLGRALRILVAVMAAMGPGVPPPPPPPPQRIEARADDGEDEA